MWSTVTFFMRVAAQTASGYQSTSALYPVSNTDAWSNNLTSAGGELAEYSIGKSFQALRFLSAFAGMYLKTKMYC